ncbi:hypothetical protein [Paenibacillus larvae]|uniref:Uncharacterized protein n=1 Tax=Paenibacillus larvae subsp. larvae TaxID=147375 RepID=A0A6C0QTZ9_9BACL|nr:hypothetical protein [Paenibacillus larvae]QHZ52194.1 hypothetical protein ERICV_03080 [Paenibacillus larvae subsp. larvae]
MNKSYQQKVREHVKKENWKEKDMGRILVCIERLEDTLNACLESLEYQIEEFRTTDPDLIPTTGVAEIAAQLLRLQELRFKIISHCEFH